MEPNELIASYVADVARLLPSRIRNDVALELGPLLLEDLQARSETAARVPDAEMTLEMLQAFGHPSEVAARYHSRWTIIDPSDTRNFVFAAVIGGALLAAASVPTALLHPEQYRGPKEFLLGWLGVLVLYFGVKSWVLRRHPKQRGWRPPRLNRSGSVLLVLLIGVGIVAYGAPQWLYAQVSGGQQLASWLDYDPTFQAARLPWLLALWVGHGVLFIVAAVRGQWTSTLRWLNLAFSVGVVTVLTWFTQAGRVFAESVPNETAHAFLRAFVFVMLIDVSVKIYREVTRVRMPDLSAPQVTG